MNTMTTALPKTFATGLTTGLTRYTRASHAAGHKDGPPQARNRRDVLHKLAGADSARFHQYPRRRPVR
jgi:hypothetical protein